MSFPNIECEQNDCEQCRLPPSQYRCSRNNNTFEMFENYKFIRFSSSRNFNFRNIKYVTNILDYFNAQRTFPVIIRTYLQLRQAYHMLNWYTCTRICSAVQLTLGYRCWAIMNVITKAWNLQERKAGSEPDKSALDTLTAWWQRLQQGDRRRHLTVCTVTWSNITDCVLNLSRVFWDKWRQL